MITQAAAICQGGAMQAVACRQNTIHTKYTHNQHTVKQNNTTKTQHKTHLQTAILQLPGPKRMQNIAIPGYISIIHHDVAYYRVNNMQQQCQGLISHTHLLLTALSRSYGKTRISNLKPQRYNATQNKHTHTHTHTANKQSFGGFLASAH